MKTALIITMVLAALAVTVSVAVSGADLNKPVTLEITSGSAQPVIVTNAKTWHYVGSGGWSTAKAIDGLTFLVGEAEITVPWNRIKSVTKPDDANWDVTLELVSGEKQELRIVGNSGDYIEGETSLGKFEIVINRIKTIKTVAEQKAPGTKR